MRNLRCSLNHDHDTEPCPTDGVQPLMDNEFYRYVDQVKHVTINAVPPYRHVSYSGTAIPA